MNSLPRRANDDNGGYQRAIVGGNVGKVCSARNGRSCGVWGKS